MAGRSSGCGRGQGCGSGQGFNRSRRSSSYKQEPDKKEMKSVPKIAGEVQGYTYETIKDHILHKLQKDLEHGKEIATNLRKGVNDGIDMTEQIRDKAEKKQMTEKEREKAP